MKLFHSSYGCKRIVLLLAIFIFVCRESSLADILEYREFIAKVSEEILKLKETYPQLAEFSLEKHVTITDLKISYSYHTHEPKRSGGWTSGVPNPDPDGIWFYIDLHDRDSTAQIHTQPITGIRLGVGNKNISFLILEGTKNKSVAGEISSILKRHGAKSLQH